MQKTTFVVSCQWDELHFYDQSSPSHSQKLSIIVFCQHQDMSADPSQKTTMFYLWHIRKFKDGNPLAFWSFSCKFKISLLSACKKSLREFWFWVSSVVFKDAHLRRFWWHNLKKISVHYLRWSRSWDIQKMKQKFSCSWMPWSRHLRLNIDKAAFWTWKEISILNDEFQKARGLSPIKLSPWDPLTETFGGHLGHLSLRTFLWTFEGIIEDCSMSWQLVACRAKTCHDGHVKDNLHKAQMNQDFWNGTCYRAKKRIL
jgi:hypothetical protein